MFFVSCWLPILKSQVLGAPWHGPGTAGPPRRGAARLRARGARGAPQPAGGAARAPAARGHRHAEEPEKLGCNL